MRPSLRRLLALELLAFTAFACVAAVLWHRHGAMTMRLLSSDHEFERKPPLGQHDHVEVPLALSPPRPTSSRRARRGSWHTVFQRKARHVFEQRSAGMPLHKVDGFDYLSVSQWEQLCLTLVAPLELVPMANPGALARTVAELAANCTLVHVHDPGSGTGSGGGAHIESAERLVPSSRVFTNNKLKTRSSTPSNGLRILEVGCGAGAFMDVLIRRHECVLQRAPTTLVGVDFSASLLDIARNHSRAWPALVHQGHMRTRTQMYTYTAANRSVRTPALSLHFFEADAESLDPAAFGNLFSATPGFCFDRVVCMSVFFYLPSQASATRVLANMAGLLCPGGRLAIMDISDGDRRLEALELRRQYRQNDTKMVSSSLEHLYLPRSFFSEQAAGLSLRVVHILDEQTRREPLRTTKSSAPAHKVPPAH